jgi:hypothetical protein
MTYIYYTHSNCPRKVQLRGLRQESSCYFRQLLLYAFKTHLLIQIRTHPLTFQLKLLFFIRNLTLPFLNAANFLNKSLAILISPCGSAVGSKECSFFCASVARLHLFAIDQLIFTPISGAF